jgi:hypothetical protein
MRLFAVSYGNGAAQDVDHRGPLNLLLSSGDLNGWTIELLRKQHTLYFYVARGV